VVGQVVHRVPEVCSISRSLVTWKWRLVGRVKVLVIMISYMALLEAQLTYRPISVKLSVGLVRVLTTSGTSGCKKCR
jgi:hypothetical protein